MGRLPKYREFLHTLQDVLETNAAGLARSLGKQYTNLTQYLSGSKKVGPKTLRSGLMRLGEWDVKAILEVAPLPNPISSITREPGIYALYDSAGNLLYVGQAINLRQEVAQTLSRAVNFPIRRSPRLGEKAYPTYRELTERMSIYVVRSPRLRHNLEALLLRIFPNQTHNNKLGNFK